MRRLSFLFVVFAFSAIFTLAQNVTQGSLYASAKTGGLGECPLKNTSVKADISGFLARVTVTQEFVNSFAEPVEAVYTFPLSQNSAVDRLTMRIGERTIHGRMLKREEARQVYEQAKEEGKTAALLDQQRPNIFAQSVANILPGETILIEISYVEILKYEDGQYEFVFPMTVGPRYNPQSVAPADALRVSPKIEETRSGHDISIEVNLDAGVPTEGVYSNSHPIATTNLNSNNAKISLREERTIPNKDFVLRYDVTGKRIEDAVLAHRAQKGGFFSLILSPPDKFTENNFTPKEIVFVLDTSGSMSGFPIEKAKEAMRLSLDGLNPQDTFNLITFAGDTHILFDAPVSATPENLARAKEFLESRRGGGGTEMMTAIKAALEPTESQTHLRVVCFMTDGYVGNEAEIIAEIQKHPKARIFSFGIGNSVNRYLLDKMAQEGRGEVEYVSLKDDGSKAARRFFERVRTPVLTDISIDWNGLPVADVYPNDIGDLFSSKPVILNGRYTKAASGTIRLKGTVAGKLLVRDIPVRFPENEPDNDVLATLWARQRVDALMSEYYKNLRDEKVKTGLREQITALGLEFGLMTQFTSFVAVEDRIVTRNGQPKRVEVPARMPDGMSSGNAKQVINELSFGTTFSSVLKTAPNVRPEPLSGVFATGAGQGSGRGNGDGSSPNAVQEVVTVSSDSENLAVTTTESEGAKTTKNSKASAGGVIPGILDRIEQHQKALRSLRADVTMTRFDAALGTSETSQGALRYAPLGGAATALRLDWTSPTRESLAISKNQYMLYRPALKTAYIGRLDESQLAGLAAFAGFSPETLKQNYNLKYLGEDNIGGTTPAWQLELTPKAGAKFKTVNLWIDANGMIVQVKLTENNGDWTAFLMSNLQKNGAISLPEFKIELPAETKLVKN